MTADPTYQQLAEQGARNLPPYYQGRRPVGVQLRPPQFDAKLAVFNERAAGITRPLVVLPTGVGKTIFAGDLSGHLRRTMFLVPTYELLEQTVRMYQRLYPDDKVGVVHGNLSQSSNEYRFVVSTIPTMYERVVRTRTPLDTGDLDQLVIDEAHHAVARTWRETANAIHAPLRLGMSATPERTDGAPLTHMFERIVYMMTLRDAISQRFLVPPDVMRIRTSVSLAKVRAVNGDFVANALARAVNIPGRNELMVKRYLTHGRDLNTRRLRKAVTFCVDIDHAQKAAEAFNFHGVRTAAVWGNDPDRKRKLAAHAAGDLDNITNAAVLIEGYDDPTIEVNILGRPTQSRSLYVQMLGRSLRLHPGKRDSLVLDFVDNTRKLELMSAWKFLGDVREQTRHGKKRAAHPRDVHPDEIFENFADLGGTLNVTDFMERVDLLHLPPEVQPRTVGTVGWHVAPPTDSQLEALRQAGHDVDQTDWTRGLAQAVIEELPPSPKQLKLLLAHQFDIFTRRWTRGEVDKALADARASGVTPDWSLVRSLAPALNAS